MHSPVGLQLIFLVYTLGLPYFEFEGSGETSRVCMVRSSDLKMLAYAIRYTGPEVIKRFSCSTQLITKFQLLIYTKYRQIKKCLALWFSDVVILLINVKMPTNVGILTFMSRMNFVLS